MRRTAVLLSLGLVLLAGVIPAGIATAMALRDQGSWSLVHAASLSEPSSWTYIRWTVVIALMGALGAAALGLPFAVLTARTDMPGRRFFTALYGAPLVLPPLLLALAWDRIVSPSVRESVLGGGQWPVALQGAALFALAYYPLVTLFVRRSLQAAGATLEEAAVLSGGPGAAFRRVTMPLALPGLAVGTLFCLVFALNDFSLVDFLNIPLDRSRAVPVVPYMVQTTYSRHLGGLEPLLFLTLPLAVVSLVALAAAFRFAGGSGTASVGTGWREPRPYRLGRTARWGATVFCLLVLTAGTVVPVVTLVRTAGFRSMEQAAVPPPDGTAPTPPPDGSAPPTGDSNVYAEVLGRGGAATALRLSIGLALAAVLLAVPVALVLGEAARRGGSATRFVVAGAALLPLALTPALVPVGAIELWNRSFFTFTRNGSPWNPVYDTSILPALVIFARVLPFTLAATWASIREVEPSQFEAAEVAGIPWDLRMRRILLPLAKPGVVLGGLLAFVFAVRELDALALVKGAPSETLLQKLWAALHFSRDDTAAAMGVILLLLLAFVFALAALLGWLSPRQAPTSRSSSAS